MNITRRHCLITFGLAASAGLPIAALAEDRKLPIYVGFPPGGAPDTVARAISDGLRGRGFMPLVENKPGAGGRLVADTLLNAPAGEPVTMLVPASMLTVYPHIYRKLRYEPLKDFAPVATACEFQFALAVGPAVPASVKTLEDFLAWARANNAKAQFGTPGAGTPMHFIGIELARMSKTNLQHIPYKGGAPALTDTMGGSVAALITTLPLLVPSHKARRIRILAQTGATRLPGLPDVPTFKEAGFPGLTLSEMFVFMVPARTPAKLQGELASALAAAVAQPKVKAALDAADYTPLTLPPDAIRARLISESRHWGEVVKETGFKPED